MLPLNYLPFTKGSLKVQNPTRFKMRPNLLMRAWMMAHLYGEEYQAVVCYAGSDSEVAFRESLCP